MERSPVTPETSPSPLTTPLNIGERLPDLPTRGTAISRTRKTPLAATQPIQLHRPDILCLKLCKSLRLTVTEQLPSPLVTRASSLRLASAGWLRKRPLSVAMLNYQSSDLRSSLMASPRFTSQDTPAIPHPIAGSWWLSA